MWIGASGRRMSSWWWKRRSKIHFLAGSFAVNRPFLTHLFQGEDWKSTISKMAPKVGLEPTTHRLTADCSTIELLWMPTGGALYKAFFSASTGILPHQSLF